MPNDTEIADEQAVDTAQHVVDEVDPKTCVDRFVVRFGSFVSWLFPLLMIAICSQVVMRKMGSNQAWLDDAQWWMYGLAVTVGFVYAITLQSHVRVDILYLNFRPAKKSRTDIFGLGWMLLPFLILMTDVLFSYSWTSFLAREGSDSPNGLHKLYLLKMSLPWIFVIAMAATVSMTIRHLKVIAPVRLWTLLLATFPAAWFALERFTYYVLWWFVRFSSPDIKPSRIRKEPLLEPAMWIALGIILFAMVTSIALSRRSAKSLQV